MASTETGKRGNTSAAGVAPPQMAPPGRRAGVAHPGAPVAPSKLRHRFWPLELYRSALGKKYVMALSGLVLLGYVLVHMIGNLKMYLGAEEINLYGEWLRDFGEPALPRTVFLWILRSALIAAFVLHMHAAWSLTMMNRRARPDGYESRRDYVVATFAARTMRWTGIIVILFVVYHLADLTWGVANPSFVRGDPYGNMIASFSEPLVALFYILANLALGLHIFHGAWSMFQSLGINKQRFNPWRRYFAMGFAAVVTLGNISFPIAVLTGVVS